jgi:hypothetical protein
MNDLWGRRLSAAVLGMLAIGLPLAWAPSASAATYHAYVCKVPFGPSTGMPASTDFVTFTQNITSGGGATNSCPSGGLMSAALDGAAHAVGQGAALIYNVPGGLSIAGFRAWRHERVGPIGNGAAPFTKISYSGAAAAEVSNCQANVGCTERGVTAPPFDPQNELAVPNLTGITEIRFDAFCGGAGGPCPATGGTQSAVIDVFAADILLDDPTAPAVGTLGGSLVAGTPVSGSQSVSFRATDGGSGVHRGSLVVDGTVAVDTVLESNNGACANLAVAPDGRPSFISSQPCPAAVSGALTLNTDVLAPGSHDLALRVTDAAGNQATAGTVKITTTGPRPAAARPTGTNGSGASRLAALTARFTGRNPKTRRLGFGASPAIRGRLVDENGKPIAGAIIDVLARERRTGARSAPIATPATAADGTFRLKLPSGPSRTITVRYTAFSEDAKPADSVTLRALVAARVSASVSPHSPRAGQPVRIRGRLRHLPRKDVLVAIQARQGGVWRNADIVETRTDGRFSWPYRFKPGQAGRTFSFRVRVKSPNYPFEPGTSGTLRVRVRR